MLSSTVVDINHIDKMQNDSVLLYRPPGKDHAIHKMILGTHVNDDSNEPNYLMIAEVSLFYKLDQ